MVNVVFITLTPLAGAPIRIADALNAYTDYKTRVINFNPANYGNRVFPEDLFWQKDQKECIELIKNADILHFHHYINLEDNVFKINFKELMKPECKIVRHFHSVFDFLVKQDSNFPSMLNKDNSNKIVVAHCAERTFLDYPAMANIIPINDPLLIPKEVDNEKVKVVYSTSGKNSRLDDRWETKGYREVNKKLKKLSKKLNFEYVLLCDTPYNKAMEIKQNADIIIGDIVTGSYHLTELEGLSQGKVVLTNLDSRTVLNCTNVLGCKDIPFVNCNLKILEPVLKRLIENKQLRREIGTFSRAWIEKYYDDKILVKKFEAFYNKVLSGEKVSRETLGDYKLAKQFLYNEIYDYDWKIDKIMKDKKSNKILKNIFSIGNEYRSGFKRKVFRILGMKFKIKLGSIKCPKEFLDEDLVLKVQNNIRKNSVLMIEANDFHGEIISGFAKHFFDLGYCVDLLMTQKNYNDNPLCRFKDDRIQTYALNHYTMKNILQNQDIIDKYDAIFINSYLLFIKTIPVSIYKYFGKILGNEKTINVTHNTWQLVKSKKYVSLAKNSLNTPIINPNYFGNVRITPKNDKTIFLISGDGLKEFSFILKTAKELLKNNLSNFKIYITGRHEHSYIDEDMKEHIEFLGFVSFEKLYSLTEESDFIIPFLDPDNPKHDYYIKDATSGAFQLCYGFLKPMLLASKFAPKVHLNSDNSIIYEKNEDLYNAMKQALELNKSDYEIMQNNLKTTVDEINKNSLETLESILKEMKIAK